MGEVFAPMKKTTPNPKNKSSERTRKFIPSKIRKICKNKQVSIVSIQHLEISERELELEAKTKVLSISKLKRNQVKSIQLDSRSILKIKKKKSTKTTKVPPKRPNILMAELLITLAQLRTWKQNKKTRTLQQRQQQMKTQLAFRKEKREKEWAFTKITTWNKIVATIHTNGV